MYRIFRFSRALYFNEQFFSRPENDFSLSEDRAVSNFRVTSDRSKSIFYKRFSSLNFEKLTLQLISQMEFTITEFKFAT